jgi:predicted nucleic acid-binding protein
LIFVDTTVWVGASDENDDFYKSSRSVVEAIRLGKLPPALTTDFVIDETVTILGKRKDFGAEKAQRVGERLLLSPRVFVVFVDELLLKDALKLYPRYEGELSLTDVVSVVVMQKYHIREIFSHDRDFDKVKGVFRGEKL